MFHCLRSVVPSWWDAAASLRLLALVYAGGVSGVTPAGISRHGLLPPRPSCALLAPCLSGGMRFTGIAIKRFDIKQLWRWAPRGAGAGWRWLPVSKHLGVVVIYSIERRAWEGRLAGGSP